MSRFGETPEELLLNFYLSFINLLISCTRKTRLESASILPPITVAKRDEKRVKKLGRKTHIENVESINQNEKDGGTAWIDRTLIHSIKDFDSCGATISTTAAFCASQWKIKQHQMKTSTSYFTSR